MPADILRPIEQIVSDPNPPQPGVAPQAPPTTTPSDEYAAYGGQPLGGPRSLDEFVGSPGPTPPRVQPPETPLGAFGGQIQARAQAPNLAASREARTQEAQPSGYDQFRQGLQERMGRAMMAWGAGTGNPLLMQYGWQMGMQVGYQKMLPVVQGAMQRYEQGDTQGAIGIYDQALTQATREQWHPTAIQQILKTRMDLGNMLAGVNRLRSGLTSLQGVTDPKQLAMGLLASGAPEGMIKEILAAYNVGNVAGHGLNADLGLLYTIDKGGNPSFYNVTPPGSNFVTPKNFDIKDDRLAADLSNGKYRRALDLARSQDPRDAALQQAFYRQRHLGDITNTIKQDLMLTPEGTAYLQSGGDLTPGNPGLAKVYPGVVQKKAELAATASGMKAFATGLQGERGRFEAQQAEPVGKSQPWLSKAQFFNLNDTDQYGIPRPGAQPSGQEFSARGLGAWGWTADAKDSTMIKYIRQVLPNIEALETIVPQVIAAAPGVQTWSKAAEIYLTKAGLKGTPQEAAVLGTFNGLKAALEFESLRTFTGGVPRGQQMLQLIDKNVIPQAWSSAPMALAELRTLRGEFINRAMTLMNLGGSADRLTNHLRNPDEGGSGVGTFKSSTGEVLRAPRR